MVYVLTSGGQTSTRIFMKLGRHVLGALKVVPTKNFENRTGNWTDSERPLPLPIRIVDDEEKTEYVLAEEMKENKETPAGAVVGGATFKSEWATSAKDSPPPCL
jgi:hypothetical protein